MAMKKKKALLKTRLKDNTVAGIHPETETSQVVDLADKYYNKSEVDSKISAVQVGEFKEMTKSEFESIWNSIIS